MEEQILDAPSHVGKKLNYAGFWIRVAAYFIDAILLWIVNVPIGLLLIDDFSFTQPSLPFQLFSLALGIVYFTAMESSSLQATLGKMAVRIKVGNISGEQISFPNALGRYFGKILSGLILCIGFMMVGWDSKKQGLHDKLADTYVYYY
jgi:uncharacterized RDD family membrane protein YckC